MKQSKHWKHYVTILVVFLMVLMSFVSNTETLHAATKQVKSISLKIDSKRVTKKTVTLYCGDKKELKVTVSPKSARKKVAFSSSNKNVASVSSKGVIKAKNAGTAKIKVTVGGQKKKATYVKIKVKNISLSLSKKTASLKVGKSLALQVKVSPRRKVKWSSSNTGVATVSSKGIVKARKAGTAKITAKVGDKKAVCKVTVKAEDKNGIRKVRRAFYDVMVNGVAPGGRYGETTLETIREIAIGTYPGNSYFMFLLKDIDRDGVEELLFLEGEELKKVDDYDIDGGEGIIKIVLALKYKESGVEVMFSDTMEYSRGEFLLKNNEVVDIGRISTYNSKWMPEESSFKNIGEEIHLIGRSYTIYDGWNVFSNRREEKKEYQFIEYFLREGYTNLGIEYFINERLVSREEWRKGIQTDIINNLIPRNQLYKSNLKNLKRVLLN